MNTNHHDCLHVNNIRVYGYTGHMPEEKLNGQWFEVSLTIWLDMSVSADTDRLRDTLNYVTVIGVVKHVIQTHQYHLIEKLASQILDDIMKQHQIITQVQITLTKPNPPIPDFAGTVSVEMTRVRSE